MLRNIMCDGHTKDNSQPFAKPLPIATLETEYKTHQLAVVQSGVCTVLCRLVSKAQRSEELLPALFVSSSLLHPQAIKLGGLQMHGDVEYPCMLHLYALCFIRGDRVLQRDRQAAVRQEEQSCMHTSLWHKRRTTHAENTLE